MPFPIINFLFGRRPALCNRAGRRLSMGPPPINMKRDVLRRRPALRAGRRLALGPPPAQAGGTPTKYHQLAFRNSLH
jgi:hypothetical protein